MDRALSSHARLQNLVADAAAQAGFKVESPFSGCPDFDVGWRELDGYTVVEIKSLNDGNENHQLRYGLGQVLQYRAALLEHFPSVWPVLAVERAPKDPCWEKLCEELDVYLVWPETLACLFEE